MNNKNTCKKLSKEAKDKFYMTKLRMNYKF